MGPRFFLPAVWMAIVVGSAAAEVQKVQPAVTAGPAALCGVWRVSAVEQNGERLPQATVQQMTWSVSDRSITFRIGAKVVAKSAYTVDWKAKRRHRHDPSRPADGGDFSAASAGSESLR